MLPSMAPSLRGFSLAVCFVGVVALPAPQNGLRAGETAAVTRTPELVPTAREK